MFFIKNLFKKEFQPPKNGVREEVGYTPDKRNLMDEEIAVKHQPVIWREKKPEEFRHFYNGEYSQDGSGSCVAWQLALMLEQEEYLENQVRRKLSARSIYAQGYVPDGGGMYVEEALKLVRNKGATLEYLLPSNNKNEKEMRKLDDYKLDAKEIAKIYRPKNYVYLSEKSFDRIAEVIQTTGKVLGCAIIGDHNFGFTKNNGFVQPPGEDRSQWWYHAIVLTDFGLINGKKYISFEHCWGKSGYKGLGYGFLSEDWLPYMYVKPFYFIELPDDYQKGKIDFHYEWKRNLGLGSRGEDVSMLQEALKILGFYAWSNPTSGYYGYLTYSAVKRFQETYKDEILKPLGLDKPTGYFGKKSREVLNKIFK